MNAHDPTVSSVAMVSRVPTNVVPANLAGNGSLRRSRATRQARCRITGGMRHAMPAYRDTGWRRVRGLNRVCRRCKVGGVSLVRPFRRFGAVPDSVHPAAKIVNPPHCHNSVTGAVACAGYCPCNHSAHYSFGSIMSIPNPSFGLTTIVRAVPDATLQAPISAVLACSGRAHSTEEAAAKWISGRSRQHAKNVT